MSRYCPMCGAEFGTDDKTCPRCSFDPSDTTTPKEPNPSATADTPTPSGNQQRPKTPGGLATLFWVVALAGALVGGGVAVAGLANAQSAPQEAAAAGIAVAIAVIPYVFARAVQELTG